MSSRLWEKSKIFVWDAWVAPGLGYALIAAAISSCAYWSFHLPPPSYSVTIMAIAAGLMALRPEMGPREKWLWAFVLFLFAIVEIRAISKDRKDGEQRQEAFITEQRKHFSEIGDGIKIQIEKSDQNFQETTQLASKQFDASMREARENLNAAKVGINQITGGDSYAIVAPDFTNPDAPTFPLSVRLCPQCQYSLTNVQVSLVNPPQSVIVYTGSVDPNYNIFSTATIPAIRDRESVFRVNVTARNRPTTELLRVRFNATTGKWECSWRISRIMKFPKYNPVTHLAEGAVFKLLEDHGWTGFVSTNVNPEKTTGLP